ncbi:MAG: lytic transglycosylase domain-containing protein [Leptospira sp.]|nr:lytic transglycosylase domain-containing protein [Leptospira sp.]
MRHFWLASRILLVLIFPLHSETNLHYLIKSHQWSEIESLFKSNSPSKESEVYSLIEFHEKSPNGNRETRLRYLISLVRGSFVTDTSANEVKKILTQTMPTPTTLFKLSYWKLYTEISDKNLLSNEEKILYLSRLVFEEDPIIRRMLDERIRLLSLSNQYSEIIKTLESVPDSLRLFLFTPDTLIRLGKAKLMSGDEKGGIEEWIKCLSKEGTQDSTVLSIFTEWGQLKGTNFYQKLAPPDLSLLVSAIPKKDRESIFKSRPDLFSTRLSYYEGFKNLTLQLAKLDKPNELIKTLQSNRSFTDFDSAWTVVLAEQFYQQQKPRTAIEILKSFPGKDAGYYRIFTASYEKLGDSNLYFENLISYLSKFPYNLFYQDRLIDFLVIRNGSSLRYADKSKFEKAISEIPNLPVKGRLVYWYLRSLKENGEIDLLKKELKRYYIYCPGSYYTRVIREEFIDLIKQSSKPDNPTYNKDSLFEYLSYTAGIPEESSSLVGKNLGFVYPKESYDLSNRLSNMSSKVQGNRTLNQAKDYFRVGEDNLGLILVNYYVKKENLTEEEKDEILVGIGDASHNTYYSAFHTRSLLKRHMIPDDPIIIPTALSQKIYPRPHRNLVETYAKENGISEDQVYALMRQESFFKETATSRSNARGLMQIMPATGRELANRMGITSYSLYEPNTSIRLGTKFLAYLLKSNENELKWASIAYNGGPGNLRKWKKQVYRGDFNHFLEDLPVKESRDYCRIVVSNYYAYDIMKKYHKL